MIISYDFINSPLQYELYHRSIYFFGLLENIVDIYVIGIYNIRNTNIRHTYIGGDIISKLKEILSQESIKQTDIATLLNVSQKTISIRLKNNDWKLVDAEKIRMFLERDSIDEIFFNRNIRDTNN